MLVTEATGQQGGAVARHLLTAGGRRVRALVRDPGKPAAVALHAAGAELLRADFDSIDGAERDSGVPHFESKYRGEEYIASSASRRRCCGWCPSSTTSAPTRRRHSSTTRS
ncbi:NmrA family NAD(P)-binding protein [Streptosporangium sandarakinum]